MSKLYGISSIAEANDIIRAIANEWALPVIIWEPQDIRDQITETYGDQPTDEQVEAIVAHVSDSRFWTRTITEQGMIEFTPGEAGVDKVTTASIAPVKHSKALMPRASIPLSPPRPFI